MFDRQSLTLPDDLVWVVDVAAVGGLIASTEARKVRPLILVT